MRAVADIADLRDNTLTDLLLNAEIVLINVRRAQIGIHPGANAGAEREETFRREIQA